MQELSESQLAQIASLTGFRPAAATPMAGATSSDLYRLDGPDSIAVLRLFRAERWTTSTEELSSRELTILEALAAIRAPVATPRPLGSLPGNGVLMSWLEGRVVLPQNPGNRWLRTLAESLARIHALDIHVPYAFESWNGTSPDSRPDWWCSESLWSRAQALTAELPCFDARFIHRDYHPVNVLWEEDRISGIVDWINACMGPVGIDVAHCRLNLALMYGLDTADKFLDAYRAAVRDYRHNACWDMESALSAVPDVRPYEPWNDFGLTGLTTELVRTRLEAFVEGAVSAYTSSASPC